MQKQKNRMWCIQYDQQTYYKGIDKVSFARYLNMIVSNKFFPQFQIQAAKQIKDKDQWNQKCWHLIQFFQSINNLFDTSQTDRKITFIDDIKLRRTLGNFRLWIDLERLYLLSFLKLDKIGFQDARVFMTLYRTVKFFHVLFSHYQYSDFQQNYTIQIQQGTFPHLTLLHRLVNEDTKEIIDDIIDLIHNFVSQNLIISAKEKPYDKVVYKKLTKSAAEDQQVNSRLNHNIKYQDNRLREIIVEQVAHISLPTEESESYYDPQIKMIKEFIRSQQLNGQHVDQQKIDKLIEDYQLKVKGKHLKNENIYSHLMKIGDNPFDENNFVIYGDLLGIDMSKRKQYQKAEQNKKQQLSLQEKAEPEKLMYYQPNFLSSIKQLNNYCANVVHGDLTQRTTVKQSKMSNKNNTINDFEPKVKQIKWDQDPDQSRTHKRDEAKDLSNNFLFRKDDEEEQEDHKFILKVLTTKSYNSETLNKIDQKIYTLQNSQFNMPKSKTLFNYKTLQFKEFNKFDFLRQLIQYQAVDQKLKKIINEKNIPDYYPRFIDEIKEKKYNDEIYYNSVQMALKKNR